MAQSTRGEHRRTRIVEFVAEYQQSYGYSPTMREIASAAGLSSTAGAAYEVRILVAEGTLSRAPRIPRSIRVVEQ